MSRGEARDDRLARADGFAPIECVWLAVDRVGAHLDPSSADLLHALGNKVCDVWTEPDCGIWELEDRRHNTFSRTGCWVALDRLVKLAERGQVADREVDRWTAERAGVRAELADGPLLYRFTGAREIEGPSCAARSGSSTHCSGTGRPARRERSGTS